MTRLHIGSGRVALPGWVNIDIKALPGVDVVHDVTRGLPFEGVELVFAEHFIEHLDFAAAAAFLEECRRVLLPAGVLRLSTPNLDWVVRTHYHLEQWANDHEAVRDCFWLNKAFRGWGHRFLYNRTTLREVLLSAGFAAVEFVAYGVSRHPGLQNLEVHERYPDLADEPHVIVVEASGCSPGCSAGLAGAREDYLGAVNES